MTKPTMDRATLMQSLSGGYIEHYEFDLHRNCFRLLVVVLNDQKTTSYDLVFEKLSHFSLDSESIRDKERLEVTEIWIDSSPQESTSEEWSIAISMWDITHVRLRCARITINGKKLH